MPCKLQLASRFRIDLVVGYEYAAPGPSVLSIEKESRMKRGTGPCKEVQY